MKKHDPKLAAHLDDAAITAFQKRLNKADGSNPFMSLTRSIVYQQIHGKAAASIYARFLNLFDPPNETWFPTPAQVLAKNDTELRSAGLSGRKAEYIRNLALHFENGSITPDKFNQMSDTEISTQLCAVKGIGQWTVDMFLMLDLHHPDVLPLGDLAVRKGVAKHFGLKLPTDKKKIFPDAAEMLRLTDIWRPYRTLGSWLMWRISNIVVTGD
ncbi:DNA glycosylase [Helicostylum pulchrum]|nr:DNA glycosylase [Helicostylum pulchrum]